MGSGMGQGDDGLEHAVFADCRTARRIAEAAARHGLLKRLKPAAGAAEGGGEDTSAAAISDGASDDAPWTERLLRRVSAVKELEDERTP